MNNDIAHCFAVLRIDGKLYNVNRVILSENCKYFKILFEDEDVDVYDVKCLDIVEERIWIDFLQIVHNGLPLGYKSLFVKDVNYVKMQIMFDYFMFDKFTIYIKQLRNNLTKGTIAKREKQFGIKPDAIRNADDLYSDEEYRYPYKPKISDSDEEYRYPYKPKISKLVKDIGKLNRHVEESTDSDEEEDKYPLEKEELDDIDISHCFDDANYNPYLMIVLLKQMKKDGYVEKYRDYFRTSSRFNMRNLSDFIVKSKQYLSQELYLMMHGLIANCVSFKDIDDNLMLHDVFEYSDYLHYTKKKVKYSSNFSRYEVGEKVIVDNVEEFQKSLTEFSFGIFDEEMKWDGIVMAGGATLHCLSSKKKENVSSDIDIWVYGEKKQERIDIFRNIMTYLDNCGDDVFYSMNGSVMTVIIGGMRRNIQVILTSCKTKFEVIAKFDLSQVQCLFDGEKVLATDLFLDSMKHQVSFFNKQPSDVRIIKTYENGFDISEVVIDCDYDKLLSKCEEEYEIMQNKYFYFDKVEDKRRLKYMISSVFRRGVVFDNLVDVFDKFDLNNKFKQIQYNQEQVINANNLVISDYIDKVVIEKAKYKRKGKEYFNDSRISYNYRPIRIKLPNVILSSPLAKFDEKTQYQILDVYLDMSNVKSLEFLTALSKKICEYIKENCDIPKKSVCNVLRRRLCFFEDNSDNHFQFAGKYHEKDDIEEEIYAISNIFRNMVNPELGDYVIKMSIFAGNAVEIKDRYGNKLSKLPDFATCDITLNIGHIRIKNNINRYDNRPYYVSVSASEIIFKNMYQDETMVDFTKA
jgi:hypothetical protein